MGSKSEEITAAKKNGSREWAPEDIEFEKNRQEIFWGMKSWTKWVRNEVELQNWQYQNSKKLDEIHHHILNYGDGEEIVWQDDVWGLQNYTQIPPPQCKNTNASMHARGNAKGS